MIKIMKIQINKFRNLNFVSKTVFFHDVVAFRSKRLCFKVGTKSEINVLPQQWLYFGSANRHDSRNSQFSQF